MDTLMLSRIQFGVSLGLHYLFAVTTLGLILLILACETLSLPGKPGPYRQVSIFLSKALGLVFTMGVATGLALPFQMGANWARFSTLAGPVFGPMLSLEATAAFALESAFMIVLIFGRNKVSPLGSWIAAAGVFLGSHLSAFLIVAANSWMETPAGFALADGRIVLTSLPAAVFNPSTLIRYAHVITTAWLTGAFAAGGLAAYYAARRRHPEFAAALFRVAIPVMLATALAQPFLGDLHIRNVRHYNPERAAVYRGVPHGPDCRQAGNPSSTANRLDESPADDGPPVKIVAAAFHLMVMLGMLMIGVAAAGAWLLWKKRMMEARRYLLLLPWLLPLPHLANEFGWIGVEIGRQPWVVYKLVRTAAASSAGLPAWQVAVSLAGIAAVYSALLMFTLIFIKRLVAKGPDPA